MFDRYVFGGSSHTEPQEVCFSMPRVRSYDRIPWGKRVNRFIYIYIYVFKPTEPVQIKKGGIL